MLADTSQRVGDMNRYEEATKRLGRSIRVTSYRLSKTHSEGHSG
jgi:hypothetical protein